MKKAEEIYESALVLLGEDARESAFFRERFLPLLNLLIAENEALSGALRGESHRESLTVLRESDPVGVADAVAEVLLPLGLAGLLIQGEEPERAAFLLNRYEAERLRLESRGRRGRRHPISRPY